LKERQRLYARRLMSVSKLMNETETSSSAPLLLPLSPPQSSSRSATNPIAMLVLTCCLRFIEYIAEFINEYAFVYVGAYGTDFTQSAKAVWNLIKSRGFGESVCCCCMCIMSCVFVCGLLCAYVTSTYISLTLTLTLTPSS